MTSDMGKIFCEESEHDMVYCMAFGCTNDSRNTKNISYHKLPDNSELKRVWLAKISREDPKISKNSVLCSEHFEQDCFERDMKAELLGTKRRAKLKSGAIPTIFSHRVPEKKRRLTSERRQKEKEKTEFLQSVLGRPKVATASCSSRDEQHHSAFEEIEPHSSNDIEHDSEIAVQEIELHVEVTEKQFCKATQVTPENASKLCQVNMCGEKLMLKSVGTQTELHEFIEQSTQTESSQTVFISDDDDDQLFSSQETSYPSESREFLSPQKDRLRAISSECSESETDEQGSLASEVIDAGNCVTNSQEDSKYIVFEQQLLELLNRCPECGEVIVKKEKNTQGTLLCMTLTCIKDHVCTWRSQPMLKRMAAGNLLLSSALLLSGATFTKVASIANIMKLQFISEKTFCNIQDEYFFPVVNEAWQQEQESVITEIGERDVWLSGDGRCDSPGFSAKYGTYTLLDQETDKVVDFSVVHVGEVSSSNAMEREGFKRCMNNIVDKGVNVKVVATDGHIGIASDMKKDHADKHHQQDVWHVSKRVTTKLTEKAKKKDCGDLFPWIKSVSNHLWWCADSCEGSKELLREKWLSIVYHCANIHAWDSADLYHQCPHQPIPHDEARKKKWLKPGSPPHDALKAVVYDKNIVKAVQQLNLCCHTGSLEVYHSVQTSYVPKRQHFSYKGMIARTQLAALHHNANTDREQATTLTGELRFKVVFPKRTKDWVAKPIMEKATKDHLGALVDAIVARKNLDYHDRSEGLDTSHIAQNIATKPRPEKAAVIAQHTSRFSRS